MLDFFGRDGGTLKVWPETADVNPFTSNWFGIEHGLGLGLTWDDHQEYSAIQSIGSPKNNVNVMFQS